MVSFVPIDMTITFEIDVRNNFNNSMNNFLSSMDLFVFHPLVYKRG